jgi:hypothetical protein
MKNLKIIIIIGLIISTFGFINSCGKNCKASVQSLNDSIQRLNEKNCQLNNLLFIANYKIDSLKKDTTERITLRIFKDRFKLVKIKRYVEITEKRPSNKEFLLGWIKRTLSE